MLFIKALEIFNFKLQLRIILVKYLKQKYVNIT